MAERWQQWMPFHIDRWRGSAHVQAMRAAARAGYLYLLASAWQSEDGSLPHEDEELQVLAGLTEEEWAQHGARILRRFARREDGRYVNDVLLAEWTAAKAVYDQRSRHFDDVRKSRSAAGKMGAEKRWSGRGAAESMGSRGEAGAMAEAGPEDGNRLAADSKSMANHRRSYVRAMAKHGLQGQEQQQEEREAEPFAANAQGEACGSAFLGLPLLGGRIHAVSEADVAGYEQAYPGVDVRLELRKLLPWLDANPEKRSRTVLGSKRRIVGWLGRAQERFQSRAQERGGDHGSNQHGGYGGQQRTFAGGRFGPVPSRGQQRVEQALEELARAGVCLTVERPEAGTGEVWAAAG